MKFEIYISHEEIRILNGDCELLFFDEGENAKMRAGYDSVENAENAALIARTILFSDFGIFMNNIPMHKKNLRRFNDGLKQYRRRLAVANEKPPC